MRRKVSPGDVYDINKKTGALILGVNRLDDFATNYLKKNCPEALEIPMPLPVYEILEQNNLIVKEATLSPTSDVFGCCMLFDGKARLFNEETGTYDDVFYPKGTILIDSKSDHFYGEKARRHSLIHEAIHWEKDRIYFEILNLKQHTDTIYPIMCRHSEKRYIPPEGKQTQENQLRILEWQAHCLVSRILMPKMPFKQKAQELIKQVASSWELIHALSEFFQVDLSSVKYRLIEVDLKDDVAQFSDFDDVFTDLYSNRDFVPLTQLEAIDLLATNPILKKWIDTGRYVFVEGYFVIADSRNIVFKKDEFKLTPRVKRNIGRYAINIQERRISSKEVEYANTFGYLRRFSETEKKMLIFAEENQHKLDKDNSAEIYDAMADIISVDDADVDCEAIVAILNDSRKTL